MKETFSQRVVEAALSIPERSVSTYGDIAKVCGGGGQAARSITGILAKAYRAGQTDIPFHRIVYSNGRVWSSAEHDKKDSNRTRKKASLSITEASSITFFRFDICLSM